MSWEEIVKTPKDIPGFKGVGKVREIVESIYEKARSNGEEYVEVPRILLHQIWDILGIVEDME
tara:strand:- start:342 stop:530 length:189 start_codon:yes stop_codon:yes gene_type:complete